MKKDNRKILIFIVVIVIILIIGGYFIIKNINKNNEVEISKTTNDIDTDINTDDGDEDIDWSIYTENNITLTESLTIDKEGIYNLTGKIEGNITINTPGNVKLVLNNVDIKSDNGPAIKVEEADNTLIYLTEGTTNTLEDSEDYSFDDEDINGVIYSKDDLIFDGSGTLIIKSNYEDGIVSKDDLKIINGTYEIESIDDGIRGKDSVYILNGTYNINSGGDGIKSTNDTDTEKGYILIENGTFNIESELDGFQAETKILIEDGTFDITTGGGSSNSSTSDNWGQWGRYQTTTNTDSAKGIKCIDNLVINNGTFNFNTSDDAIHSNNYVGISNGDITISSGDDGIHSDTELIIDSGNIGITKSYEGIESAKITINGGNINIVASDDGINVAGGNDSSGMDRPGMNNFNSNTNNTLTINNGTIYVNATGDGIDVNGIAYMYNGYVTVDGPTDSGNGTLDYDREFVVDGGTLIAAGSSGMLQSITSNNQYNITVTFNSNYQGDSKVRLLDSNNSEIISYTPSKNFSSIIISSPLLEKGKTYIIEVDGEEYDTFEVNSISTIIGNSGGSNPMNGGMGKPGMRR
ncbi:MAG: carbohydrate-binding domain-containing protein [Bacilli bacterium]|nr:carbohydrate-binding domain-containing protein [Bacilli bacterium]